jgi:hypothetical protein
MRTEHPGASLGNAEISSAKGIKHVARMQRSGIREWRSSELPGLRYAPSGLRSLELPKEVGSDLAAGCFA